MAGQAQRASLARNGKSLEKLQKEIAKLRKQLKARDGDLDEAVKQQTAVSDVLKVISRSTFDLEPVLETVVATAARLVSADMAAISRREGDVFRFTVGAGTTPQTAADIARLRPFYERHPFVPGRGTIAGRVALEGRAVQIEDITADSDYEFSAASTVAKMRSVLGVPLMREGTIVGTLTLARQRVEPFTARQIDLVQTFADQAVIAIENTRLIAETREALDQQIATAEVLQVINSSPGNLAPVFDAILEKAHSLCGVTIGALESWDGRRLSGLAVRGLPAQFAELVLQGREPGPNDPHWSLVNGSPFVHITDLAAVDDAAEQAAVVLGGIHTFVAVPLRKDNVLLGRIVAARREVRPFLDKEIALLENFAAQAVIAMENARLLTETREALEQQTATAEVLGVINSSPGDLIPVFQAILEKAHALCGVELGSLQLYDGEQFRAVAVHGLSDALAERLKQGYRPSQKNRLIEGASFVQIADLAEVDDPLAQTAVALGGTRTHLFIALRKDGALLGQIVAARKEVRPFSDKQVALLENFAAQAVIAIENARLLTETRESLAQQTATAEVLGVINASPGDLNPVFAAMLEKAMRLCDAAFGQLDTYDGNSFHTAAMHGVPAAFAEYRRNNPPNYGSGSGPARMLAGERILQHLDLMAEEPYRRGDPNRRALVDLGGARSALQVGLVKDQAFLGFITLFRQEVRPFTVKQVNLLENFAAQAVIAMENARLITETREALEQQTATAEVLGVINSSPGDLTPVFNAMLDKATRLSGASFGILWTYDHDRFKAVAFRNVPPAYAEFLREPVRPEPLTAIGRIASGEAVAHIPDIATDEYYEAGGELVRQGLSLGGFRTVLAVSMRKDQRLLGAITIYRKEPLRFAEKQIALLQNFAAQAVIAMENARLITETREALEQQTATAEVLGVINSSPGHLAPVFDAMLEKATRLCAAGFGSMWIFEGEQFRAAAVHAVPAALAEFVREPVPVAGSASLVDIVQGQSVVHVADLAATELYHAGNPVRRAYVDLGGARTLLSVALRKDNTLLGAFNVFRQEVRPFSDKEIALVQNFAAQAVIAIENARLITETREALEQQTATAEVLQVINSSPGDLAPVFKALIEKAMHLCGADYGILRTFDGELFHGAASRGVPPAYAEFLARNPQRAQPGTIGHRIIAGEPLVHVIDVADDEVFGSGSADPHRRALMELGGAHTSLVVPLRKDQALLGAIQLYRQHVQAFTARQIALLQNFAAQAVIAMENARLITETREALEQQTATAEVLGVINASPGDLAPVFDAILEKAHRLCDIAQGSLELYDGERFWAVAVRGLSDNFADMLRQGYPASDNPATRPLIEGSRFTYIPDLAETEYSITRSSVDLVGVRTLLCVPLRREGQLLGMIASARKEVRKFSEKEIALLENFATQAVIAMENARLITETREALEQQTATAEVLGVINSSPGDLGPVFDAMLEKATRLCEAAFGVLLTYDGDRFQHAALRNVPARYAEFMREHPPTYGPETAPGRLARGERLVHVTDMRDTDAYRSGDQNRRAIADLAGARTLVAVPLRKDGALVGAIVVYRQEVRSFTDKQIALLQNFAAQAVIAMENARLITETREALEQQTATADVLQVINSSPGDLVPVFDAMLEKAHILCGVEFGSLQILDGDEVRAVAARGLPEPFVERLRQGFRPEANHPIHGLLSGDRIIQLDMAELDNAIGRAAFKLGGMRTVLFVPLRQDDVLLGYITAGRPHVRAFSEKEIALLENFAAQAVIAMENARLITETREALDQQTATAEVLQVINSSPGDLAPVFDAMLEKALTLCGAAFGQLNTYDGEHFRTVATLGVPKSFAEYREKNPPAYGPGTASERILTGDRLVHIADLKAEEAYRAGEPNRRALVDLGGARTMLIVALRKDEVVLGTVMVYRQEVRPFSDKQIALLQNFAAQAVIAMENARLLEEIRQRQAELRVTFDNMGDGVVMFDENLRLAAWNRNFQEMLDLPDTTLSERPSYAEYLHLLAKRGEFGAEDVEAEVSRRLENTDQEFRQERTRPDGRAIEVRRNAVPDGGFVLIYSDVTERKRSEAEISAARDAAEAAYRDLKAAQASLVQAEKMASLGQLTAGIAHEIKNPLNFVNNFAGLSVELLDELKEVTAPAMATLDEDKRAEADETIELLTSNLEKIAEHGRRADNIVKSMLEHSRGATGERRAVDLNALVEEALNLAYHGARAQDQSFNITLERDYARDLPPIELVPQDITRVCLNLFGNGFYAATKRQREGVDPKFRPTLKLMIRDLGDAVEIRARDNGVGISPEIKDKLFQPFFTTKPTGEGTGLGLSISYDIVTQQHGGTIEVDSQVGEFTEFTVRLPRKSMPRAAA